MMVRMTSYAQHSAYKKRGPRWVLREIFLSSDRTEKRDQGRDSGYGRMRKRGALFLIARGKDSVRQKRDRTMPWFNERARCPHDMQKVLFAHLSLNPYRLSEWIPNRYNECRVKDRHNSYLQIPPTTTSVFPEKQTLLLRGKTNTNLRPPQADRRAHRPVPKTGRFAFMVSSRPRPRLRSHNAMST